MSFPLRLTRKIALFAAAAFAFSANVAVSETTIPFTLDWKFEGPSAPYFAAIDNGHFAAAGLCFPLSAADQMH